ncbi:MAG: hypothetical protein WKF73_19620 [Nocardioidaceae bacterium]
MPGLSALRAGYRDIDVRYRDLPDGAEIAYATDQAGTGRRCPCLVRRPVTRPCR